MQKSYLQGGVSALLYMEKEKWENVKGYYGLYEVSNKGNVRSILTGKTFKNSLTPKGYVCIPLCRAGRVKRKFVHRLVAESFLDIKHGKIFVNHINNIRTDNRVENLEWCTTRENVRHCMKYGRHAHGDSHGISKLNSTEVKKIKELIKSIGVRYGTYAKIGRMFNVDRTTISKIHRGIAWKHIQIGL